MAEAVMFRQRIEPLRPALVRREDGIRKLSDQVPLECSLGIFVVFGRVLVAKPAGSSPLTQAEATRGLPMVESDERVGLELVHPLSRLFV